MLAVGAGRTGNRRAHGDHTRRSGALVRGTRTRVLVLAMALAGIVPDIRASLLLRCSLHSTCSTTGSLLSLSSHGGR